MFPNDRRVLITGISGFVGSHLADHLFRSGAIIFGVDRCERSAARQDGATLSELFIGDLLDQSFLQASLKECRPTHVFHLAGVLSGAPGGSAVQYNVNVLGTVSLLEAVTAVDLSPWILVASSSAVYGMSTIVPTDE